MDETSLISSMKEITNCNDQQARFYLETSEWDVELATATFLSTQPSLKEEQQAPTPTTQSQTTSMPNKSNNRTGGIKGFSDYKEPEDKDAVNWFTGGEKSGLQVQAPPKNKDKIIDEVFKNAQDQGAVSVGDYVSPDSVPFSGTGFKLGNTKTGSQVLPSNVKKEIRKVITMWKNGFSVDDGPLRLFNDPQNQVFLNSLNTGKVPQELYNETQGSDITVDLIDRRGEDWKEPPKIIKPFSGSGNVLGSTSSTPVVSVKTNAGVTIKPDESKPITSIQIRLLDGNKIVGKFNLDHTIRDIRDYINSMSKTSVSYVLASSFPQKVLTNENETIKDAGLLNAVVIQRSK